VARQHNKAVTRAPKGRPPRAKALNLRGLERGKQVLRLFSLLRALENTRRGLTVEELHSLLEDRCTVRTVYRDLEQLQHAGFAMDVEEGRYKLSSASRSLAATPLRADEVLALLLSADVLEPIAATAVAKTQQSLRERLVASLTPQGRAFLSEQRESLRATNPSPTRLTASDSTLTAIEQGRELEQCVQLCYRDANGVVTDRVVEPHLLWLHAGRPYVVAYCRSAQDYRTFALQRITAATLLDETFERRADFDPRAYTERGFGVFHGPTHSFELHFDASVAHLARERAWHASQTVSEHPNGAVTLTFTAAGLPEVAAWVASFGGAIRACAPPELVTAVKSLHEAGLLAHGGEGSMQSSELNGDGPAAVGKLAGKRPRSVDRPKNRDAECRLTSVVKEE
jgi:predicted DNA-binding transcriptional regulator YafY